MAQGYGIVWSVLALRVEYHSLVRYTVHECAQVEMASAARNNGALNLQRQHQELQGLGPKGTYFTV